ncbi:MAG: hypothetical protein ACFFDO_05355 [Candidatus Thorarchaeota archaeon]
MPTFGHIFYGLCLLIPILYFTQKEDGFNYKVAFIFLANNIFGPDIVHLLFITPFHSIIGFAIYAIPLSLVFSYSSRFSLKSSGKKLFPLKFVDEGIREVNWKNSYCITVAGGISHFFIDQFYHFEKEMQLWPGINIHHDEMLAWGGVAYHTVTPLIIIGEMIVVTTILLSLYYFRKGHKETFIVLILVTLISIALMIFISTDVYGGEREFGVIVHSIVYVLIPLFLLMYAARDVKDNPREIPDTPKISRKSLLNIVALISIGISIFFIVYAYFAISKSETIASLIGENPTQSTSEIATSVVIIGYVFFIVSVILFFSSIGLFFKINICRYIVIAICCYLLIFGFPLAIALFLCEKDVKALFGLESED